MTSGEKLIWAAMYARELRYGVGDEPSMVATAVENAWAAVQCLREVTDTVSNGWGEDSEVFQMLVEMQGPEEEER